MLKIFLKAKMDRKTLQISISGRFQLISKIFLETKRDRKILQALTMEVFDSNIEIKNLFKSKDGQENPAGLNSKPQKLK